MENTNILASCQKNIEIPSNAADCAAFVRAVAKDFGWILQGQANHIFDYLQSSPAATKFGMGVQGADAAARQAATGAYLVIGASRSQGPNGHVAIVTGHDASGNVLVYGGKLHEAWNASINERITKRAWARYKLTDPHVAAEPPYFFGLRISPPYKG